jgi:hypothetical protein
MSNWMLTPLADISLKATIEMTLGQAGLVDSTALLSGAHEGDEEMDLYCFT